MNGFKVCIQKHFILLRMSIISVGKQAENTTEQIIQHDERRASMSVQLLDKTRKINKLLHNTSTTKVVFNDICNVLLRHCLPISL